MDIKILTGTNKHSAKGGEGMKIVYVKHTDLDTNVVRFYGPFSPQVAQQKVEHLRRVGHGAEIFPTPLRFAKAVQ